MNVNVLLFAAFTELNKAAKGTLEGTKIENIAEIINTFAIFSAVASGVSLLPGIGSVIAMISQTGLVWGTYIKINKELGISMKENVAKFIGAAMLTNIAANAVTYLLAYVGAGILSYLPFANVLSTVLLAAIGYILIYLSAVLYLKLLTEVMKAKGTFELDESDDTKKMIKSVVENSNLDEIIKEGRKVFKEAEKSGEFKKAMNNMKCPYCGETIKKGQKYCSACGNKLF